MSQGGVIWCLPTPKHTHSHTRTHTRWRHATLLYIAC